MNSTKIFVSAFLAALTAIMINVGVSAHTEEEIEGSSGVLPKSPFYSLDRMLEKISLLFSFNEQDKIPKLFRYADERTAEMRQLASAEKPESIDEAAKSHAELIRQIKAIYEKSKSTENLEFYANLEKSIESHVIEINELDEAFPERDTLQKKLAYDMAMNSILTPMAELNIFLIQRYTDFEKKAGKKQFNEKISKLRRELNIAGIIDIDAERAIDSAEEWLKKSQGNPFFAEEHYESMENDLKLAKKQKEAGNFFGAKVMAAELAEHIEREMFLADGLSKEKYLDLVEIKNNEIFQLTAFPINREIAGRKIRMYSYNGQIPGPLIKVKQGSVIYINFTNNIDMETTVHWHGIRLDNKFDGVPHETQEPVMPGESFLYELKFPDEGIYWYHPHVREDKQQELGLYGNIVVEPLAKDYYNNASKEVFLFLDDIKLAKNDADAFRKDFARFALMGRFGNVMLVNGKEQHNLEAVKGDIIRFYITNSANTRVFNFSIEGHKLKIVGSDSGKFERETIEDSVIISPAERYIIEALFGKEGEFKLMNKNSHNEYVLGHMKIKGNLGDNDDNSNKTIKNFNKLNENSGIKSNIEKYKKYLGKQPDYEFDLTVDMPSMAGMGHEMMMHENENIEWEDEMPIMNAMSTSKNTKWIIKDRKTGKQNMDINHEVRLGDVKMIRIFNDPKSMHPMQHPIHLHGQKFLVLAQDGQKKDNLAWKDTVLVPKGSTIDLLVDFSNPGKWMFHCHIPEHLEAGMMSMFTVV